MHCRPPRGAAPRAALLIVLSALSLTMAAAAVASPTGGAGWSVETYTLPNGLTVILHEDHTQPSVTIDTWFGVGSKDEQPGRTGFAHLFEHLMFMGTTRVPDNQFDVLMERGGGANNASTSTDRTNYYSWGPRSLLPTLLWLDADRLEGLGKAMTAEKVELQKSVVRNERRQNVENRPYGVAELIIPEALYPEGHPYHHPVIGSHEDLEAATLQDVKAFFDTYYVPGNASLVVAGDFDPDEARRLVAETFGAVPARPLPEHLTAAPVVLDREVRRLATDRVRYPRLYLVWHSPAAYQPGDADLDVLASLLADRTTGRLRDRLVLQDQLAQDVSAYQYSKELGSEFHIEATAAEGADLERIKHVILEEIARLQAEGPTEAEVARVRAATEAGFLRRKESLRFRADMLNAYRKAYGEANSFDRDLARRLAPTAESVQAWARQVLGEGRLDLRVLPAGAAVAGADLDRRPENLTDTTSEPPVATRLELKGGQPLYVVSRPGSGLFSGAVIVPGGESLLPADQAGLGALAATMVTQGAGDLDAAGFADAVAALGARIRADVSPADFSVQVSGLTSRLDETLALFADALQRPRLESADLAREKDLQLAAIRSRDENPDGVARRVMAATLFGSDDPRGRPRDGWEDTVAQLSGDDVAGALPHLLAPARASFVFVGDFTPEQIARALDANLGKWRGGDDANHEPLRTLTAPHPGLLLVDRPGAPQTVISVARPVAAPTDDAQRVTRECLATLFGGSFTSRLMQNIREEHGYSYGARANLSQRSGQWLLGAGSAVQTQVTGAALGEFRKEFDGLATGDVTPGELEKAVRTVRYDLETAGTTTDAMARVLDEIVREDRPLDDVNRQLAQMKAVTLDAVNAEASGGDYAWEDLLIVLVGDRAAVLPQLAEAGFATPLVVDAAGRPLAE